MKTGQQDRIFLKSLTVLYVEDEQDAREQFTVFLKRIVGTLIVAQNGAEGLAAYYEHHPHLIITDIQMPAMDGLSMAKEIRKTGEPVHIIVLTAFEQLEFMKRSINIGIDKYVTKPVNGRELYEVMQECARKIFAEEALRSAARTDLLTGLVNRRELMNRFAAEKSRAERHGSMFSAIIADIDHFKNINDTYGHLAGDRVLKEVANIISSSIRAEDTCGRWGGEEFMLLLPQNGLEKASAVADKLRLAISAMVLEWEGKKITVTISLGVAAFMSGTSMDECFEAADAALYRAKNGGRNRVELATT